MHLHSLTPDHRVSDVYIYIYMYIYTVTYIHIYMAVSRLFLYMGLTPVVPVVCCMSFAWDLVCVMYEIERVSCAGRSLCYVRAQACVMSRL